MAAKKTRTGGPRAGSKTAFVLALPKDMPAKDAVAAAKAKGISISEGYVHNIRSKHGGKGRKRGPGRPAKRQGARTRAVNHRRTRGGFGSALDNQLRAAIADLGLARAREVLAEVENEFLS